MLGLIGTIHSTASLGMGILACSNLTNAKLFGGVWTLLLTLSICLCLQCQDNEFAVSSVLNYVFIPLAVPWQLQSFLYFQLKSKYQLGSPYGIYLYTCLFFKCHNESRLPLTFEMTYFSSLLPVLTRFSTVLKKCAPC